MANSPTQSRGPASRLTAMGVLLAASTAFGLFSMKMPWYHFSFAANVIAPETYEQVNGVVAELDITGFQLSTLELASGPMQQAMPVGVGGLLLPAVWLIAGCLLGLASATLRNGFLALLGAVAFYLSYGALSGVRAAMENPSYGGTYNTPGPGMSWFTLSVFFAAILTVFIGIQSLVVNRHEKQARRDAGEEVPPSIIETLGALKLSNVARIASAVAQESETLKKDAKDKVASK